MIPIAKQIVFVVLAAALQGTLAMANPSALPPPPPPVAAERSAPLPPPAPPARGPRIAVPKNPRQWAGRIHDAYPIEARNQGWEGVVALSVTVTRDGRATECMVTQSSGHAVLDKAACDGMALYSRFEPALDRNGNPVAGTWSTRITYRL